jgi:hypothetical protein
VPSALAAPSGQLADIHTSGTGSFERLRTWSDTQPAAWLDLSNNSERRTWRMGLSSIFERSIVASHSPAFFQS